jgi:NitT/TauT family transport system substrate-binding protein
MKAVMLPVARIVVGAVLALGLGACRKASTTASAGPLSDAASGSTTAATSAARGDGRAPLRIAYSDWPGWVAWDIAVRKNYFKEEGVDVSFVWLEYVPSMEAFSDGKVDAVCMTNGDALVVGSSGAPSVGILLNDYSNGNDMIVARAGFSKMQDLRGKKIGVEVGFVDHLLLMQALQAAKMSESDVDIVNTKTHETPQALKSGSVSAIAAWQPNSGYALEEVPGSKPIFTSSNVPGLIYDLLFVSRASLEKRRADWKKVVKVWFRVAAFVDDPAHRREAAEIMGATTKMSADKYEKLMDGTRFLGATENKRRLSPTPGLDSVQGSSHIVDQFNVANHVYKDSIAVEPFFDPTLVDEVLADKTK